MAFTVVYDASVLYPFPLRDLLVQLATTDLFRARWTARIQDEWIDALVRNRPELADRLERTRALMEAAVPDCLVTGYEALIEGLVLPDAEDRHVLAGAIQGHASVIVTRNLRDFPDDYCATFGIEAQHPDEFLCHVIDLNPVRVCEALEKLRLRLKNPPLSRDEYFDALLRQELPETVALLRQYLQDG